MKKEVKKSQITIFLIIALLIVFAIILILIFRDKIGLTPETFPEIGGVNQMAEDCIKARAIDAIRLVGLQGGYVNMPEPHLNITPSGVAYGYYEGKKTLPLKKEIEKEINFYIKYTLPFCIDETDFPNLNITLGKAEAKSEIKEDFVSVSAKISISASKDKKSFIITKNYESEIPIKLGKLYNIADVIVNKEIENPGSIDLTYLSSLDFYPLIVPYDKNTIIFSITDDTGSEIPYTLRFANKFKG